MIRKLVLVAIASVMFITLPVLLTAAVAPAKGSGTGTGTFATSGTIRAAVQPSPEYPPWLYDGGKGEPNWAVLENCWIDRFLPHAQRQVIFQQQLADMGGLDGRRNQCPPSEMTIWCDWRVAYPSRYWVEQGCGRVAGWGPGFGAHWWQGWDRHPAKDWVAAMRAGGQP